MRKLHCLIFYPQDGFSTDEIARGYKILPCSSITDGKAKVVEYLRDMGVLVEESDAKAEGGQ